MRRTETERVKRRNEERGHRWYWNYLSDYSSIDASFEITFSDNSDIDRAVLLLRVSTMRFSITNSEIITSRVTDRAASDIFAQSHFPRFFRRFSRPCSFFLPSARARSSLCVCIYMYIRKYVVEIEAARRDAPQEIFNDKLTNLAYSDRIVSN